MATTTKERMVAGAADLMSRRGVRATTLRDVVQHTGTPRGSLAHHFPGGKPQMLEDAVRYATEAVAGPLQNLLLDKGVAEGLQAFIGWWRRLLENSAFEAGCPVLAVAIEPLPDDAPDAETSAGSAERLRQLAHEAFERWQSILGAALRREGLPAARAHRLSTLIVASVEGTVAMCRVARSAEPLDEVRRELEALVQAALAGR